MSHSLGDAKINVTLGGGPMDSSEISNSLTGPQSEEEFKHIITILKNEY